jgi:hypothetical protein
MLYELLYYKGKRPNNSASTLKNELISYLREEYAKGHLPSKRELQNKFHLRLDISIKNLYETAGLVYKSMANQSIKSQKARLLLDLVVNNLSLFGLELYKYRNVHERGIDILAKGGGQRIGVELKAYNKFERLKNKDIEQVKRFILREKLDSAIIITTTDLGNISKHNNNITLIKYSLLKQILTRPDDITKLNFILTHSTNQEDFSKAVKRQQILDHVLTEYVKTGKKCSCIDIVRAKHLHIYTYFSGLSEIYQILKIPPPLGNMGGLRAKNPDKEAISLWKKEFKQFILEEIKAGRKYPSGVEIARHFGISNIWNVVKVSELYDELELKSYLKRGKGSRTSTSVQDAGYESQ